MTNGGQSSSGVSRAVATGKDGFALLRDAALAILAVLLILWPQAFNNILVNAGFEEGSFAGLKWKSKLSETDKALVSAQSTIADLKAQIDKLNAALAEAKPQVTSTDLKAQISSLEQSNTQLSAASSKVQASVQSTISGNAPYVQKLQSAIGSTAVWGVVLGGDTNLDGAKHEAQVAAPRLGITNAAIYYRQGSYRTVAIAPDRTQAEQFLEKAKGGRSDAYIVNMATWCPAKADKDGYIECANP